MPSTQSGNYFSRRPWLISILLVLILSVWLGLGAIKAEEGTSTAAPEAAPLARVVFQSFIAENIEKKIDLYGRTAADRTANLGAEIAGKIIGLSVKKGDSVKVGQPIAQIDKGDLPIQLERAQAMLNVRQQEFNASKSLKSRGLQGEVAYSTAAANLTEAKAMVGAAKLALRNTLVKAPFTGIVDSIDIELGDFVSVGDPVAMMIDLSVLVIEADVSERHIQSLSVDQTSTIRFIDGQKVTGTLRYISRVSSLSTNTFPIEIEVPNPNQRIPAGVSAEVELALEDNLAIKITPAMLALDESGNLGVKTLQQEKVVFVPIQLVKAEQDGVWLTGLGESVDIIVLGQGFVRDGDFVEAISVDQANRIAQQADN
ncbi:efflux transporter periplasmic adaptor subunit [Vibrio sp. 10N.286.49.C2]|uniref:efflux RND transporter periplasmic adaptor subunit n=1 Tax=unclassified Vibrio TaxID=2614977 RepID=UPI000C8205BE|nr:MULTISPECIES: efflux RND transporter periplasmic adaptor subunit [unclassified Vibrio]PMH29506.1 efflux transporter periplasmic adaptor subunit [Vibrio sp. 10N.286.49.C2]PMH56021.1 efflux transporter periplasmic adaptor subunit [Vibrio sp. 10N.286.49.B1]PMH80138.1 efflux transporter periplasmic adaptor subunit [Vibrio sp. 10N.286.48.B7]